MACVENPGAAVQWWIFTALTLLSVCSVARDVISRILRGGGIVFVTTWGCVHATHELWLLVPKPRPSKWSDIRYSTPKQRPRKYAVEIPHLSSAHPLHLHHPGAGSFCPVCRPDTPLLHTTPSLNLHLLPERSYLAPWRGRSSRLN